MDVGALTAGTAEVLAAGESGAAVQTRSGHTRSLSVDGLEHALRLGDAIALRVIDTQRGEHLDDLGVLGEFGDGLLAGEMPDFVDRTHHLAVDGVVQDLAHERAVDLEEIDGEVLEVTERAQARAEVVEREAAAELAQRLDEAIGLREARHGGGLGDLEADLARIDAALLELLDDERQELVVAQALARKVDRAHRELLALVGLAH